MDSLRFEVLALVRDEITTEIKSKGLKPGWISQTEFDRVTNKYVDKHWSELVEKVKAKWAAASDG